MTLNASDSGVLSNGLFSHCGCFGTEASRWDLVRLCPQPNSWTSHSGTYRNFPKNKTLGNDLGSLVGAGHVLFHLFTSFSVSSLSKSSYSRSVLLCIIFIQSVVIIHVTDSSETPTMHRKSQNLSSPGLHFPVSGSSLPLRGSPTTAASDKNSRRSYKATQMAEMGYYREQSFALVMAPKNL